MPNIGSLDCGPYGASPRLGFSPTRPLHPAGMRIDPPPSFAPAAGTMPAATADADPPDEPPGVRVRSHGLRHGPQSSDSVMPLAPNSGVLVLPKMTRPAERKRSTTSAFSSATKFFRAREPIVVG